MPGGGAQAGDPPPQAREHAAQGRLGQRAAGGDAGRGSTRPRRAAASKRAGRTTLRSDLQRELVAQAQERGELARRDPLEPAAIDRVVRHTEPGREQQRAQELVAELAVAVPVGAFRRSGRPTAVDEDRLGTAELDVVGGGVGEGEAVLQELQVQVQMQEGGGAERGEGPLVGIGDERDPRVLQQERGALRFRGRTGSSGRDLGARRAGRSRTSRPKTGSRPGSSRWTSAAAA